MAYESLLAGNPGTRRIRPPRLGRCRSKLYRRRARSGERGPRRAGHAGGDARPGTAQIPFAPPFLRDGPVIVSHTAAILLYLGGRIGLRRPMSQAGCGHTRSSSLSPISLRRCTIRTIRSTRTTGSTSKRMRRSTGPACFAKTGCRNSWAGSNVFLRANPAGPDHLVGRSVSYADLSLFQLVEGLLFAFPLAVARELATLPHVTALHRAVPQRPRLRAYLASEQRVPFGTGIFRRYPELDG